MKLEDSEVEIGLRLCALLFQKGVNLDARNQSMDRAPFSKKVYASGVTIHQDLSS